MLLNFQENLSDEQKAAERAKPVSSTPVPGTPWYYLVINIVLFEAQL